MFLVIYYSFFLKKFFENKFNNIFIYLKLFLKNNKNYKNKF
jgi:hypothetical protein